MIDDVKVKFQYRMIQRASPFAELETMCIHISASGLLLLKVLKF